MALPPNIDVGPPRGRVHLSNKDMAGLITAMCQDFASGDDNRLAPAPTPIYPRDHHCLALYFDFRQHALDKTPPQLTADVCLAVRKCLAALYDRSYGMPYHIIAAFCTPDFLEYSFWMPCVLWSDKALGHVKAYVARMLGEGFKPDTVPPLPLGRHGENFFGPLVSSESGLFQMSDFPANLYTLSQNNDIEPGQPVVDRKSKLEGVIDNYGDLLCLMACRERVGGHDILFGDKAPSMVRGAAKTFSRAFATFMDRREQALWQIDRANGRNKGIARRHEAVHGPEGTRCSCGHPSADHRAVPYPPINMMKPVDIADSSRGLASLYRDFALLIRQCEPGGDYKLFWEEFNAHFAFCNGTIYYRKYDPQFDCDDLVRLNEKDFRLTFNGLKILVPEVSDKEDAPPKLNAVRAVEAWLGDSGMLSLRPQRNTVDAVYLQPVPLARGIFADPQKPAHLMLNNRYINLWQGFAVHRQLEQHPDILLEMAKKFHDPDPDRWECSSRVIEFQASLWALLGFNDQVYVIFVQWIASLLIHPNVVHQKAMIIIGAEGTWKSTVLDLLLRLFGSVHGYKSTQMDAVVGQFNDPALRRAVLLAWDDAKPSREGASVLSVICNLLTGLTMTTETKYADKQTAPNPTRGLLVVANPRNGDVAGNFLTKDTPLTDDTGRRLFFVDWHFPTSQLTPDAKEEIRDDMAFYKRTADSPNRTLQAWELESAFFMMRIFDPTAFLREHASREPPKTMTRMSVIKQKMPTLSNVVLGWLGQESQIVHAPPGGEATDRDKCKRIEADYKTAGPINPLNLGEGPFWFAHKSSAGQLKGWLGEMSHPILCWSINISSGLPPRSWSVNEVMEYFDRHMPGCVTFEPINAAASRPHPWGNDPIAEKDLYAGFKYVFKDLKTCKAAFEKINQSATSKADYDKLRDLCCADDVGKWKEKWDDRVDLFKAKLRKGFTHPLTGKLVAKADFRAYSDRCYYEAYLPSLMTHWMKCPAACFDDEEKFFLREDELLSRAEQQNSRCAMAERLPQKRVYASEEHMAALVAEKKREAEAALLRLPPKKPLASLLTPAERAALDEVLYEEAPLPSPDYHSIELAHMSDEEARIAAEEAEKQADAQGEYGADEKSDESERKKRKVNRFIADEAEEDDGENFFDKFADLSQGGDELSLVHKLRVSSPSEDLAPMLEDPPPPSL